MTVQLVEKHRPGRKGKNHTLSGIELGHWDLKSSVLRTSYTSNSKPAIPHSLYINASGCCLYTSLSSRVDPTTHCRSRRRLGGRAATVEGGRAEVESRKETIHPVASSLFTPSTAARRKQRRVRMRSAVFRNPLFSACAYSWSDVYER